MSSNIEFTFASADGIGDYTKGGQVRIAVLAFCSVAFIAGIGVAIAGILRGDPLLIAIGACLALFCSALSTSLGILTLCRQGKKGDKGCGSNEVGGSNDQSGQAKEEITPNGEKEKEGPETIKGARGSLGDVSSKYQSGQAKEEITPNGEKEEGGPKTIKGARGSLDDVSSCNVDTGCLTK